MNCSNLEQALGPRDVPPTRKRTRERKGVRMMSEREFCLKWRKLFAESTFDESAYAKADALIEALPQTSPLRQRYGRELSDLQKLKSGGSKTPVKPSRRRSSG